MERHFQVYVERRKKDSQRIMWVTYQYGMKWIGGVLFTKPPKVKNNHSCHNVILCKKRGHTIGCLCKDFRLNDSILNENLKTMYDLLTRGFYNIVKYENCYHILWNKEVWKCLWSIIVVKSGKWFDYQLFTRKIFLK